MFEELVAKFIDNLTKATNILYSVYYYLLSFELSYFNIGLIGFINFLGFYRTKNLTIATIIIFKAETIRSILNDENVVYTIGSG